MPAARAYIILVDAIVIRSLHSAVEMSGSDYCGSRVEDGETTSENAQLGYITISSNVKWSFREEIGRCWTKESRAYAGCVLLLATTPEWTANSIFLYSLLDVE